MSFHALLGRQHFTALFLASDSFCLLVQDNPHGVGEEAIQVSSWGWALSIHCFLAWRIDFKNCVVKSSFSSHLNVSPFLSSYNFCSRHWNWDIPLWRFSSISLGGWRPPFHSPPRSSSTFYTHSPFLGRNGEGLLLMLSCPLCVCKCFHCRVKLWTLFSIGAEVWVRHWFCTVCFRKKASSPLLGSPSYSSCPGLDGTDWNRKLKTTSQEQKHPTKPGPINSATTKWQKSYWRPTRCQTVTGTEDLLGTRLW